MLKNERVGATQENREGVKDQARGEERQATRPTGEERQATRPTGEERQATRPTGEEWSTWKNVTTRRNRHHQWRRLQLFLMSNEFIIKEEFLTQKVVAGKEAAHPWNWPGTLTGVLELIFSFLLTFFFHFLYLRLAI